MAATELLAIAAPSAQAAAYSPPAGPSPVGQGAGFSAAYQQADAIARQPDPVARSANSSGPRGAQPAPDRNGQDGSGRADSQTKASLGPAGSQHSQANAAAKPDAKSAAKPDTKSAVKPDAKPAAQPDTKSATKPDAKPAAQPDTQSATKPDAKPAAQPDAKPVVSSADRSDSQAGMPGTVSNQAGNQAPAGNVAVALAGAAAAIAQATPASSGQAAPPLATAPQPAKLSPLAATNEAATPTAAAVKAAVAGSEPLGAAASSALLAANPAVQAAAAKAAPTALALTPGAAIAAAVLATVAATPGDALPVQVPVGKTAGTPGDALPVQLPVGKTAAALGKALPAQLAVGKTAAAPGDAIMVQLPIARTADEATTPAAAPPTSAGPGSPGGKDPPLIAGMGKGSITQVTAMDGSKAGSQTTAQGPNLQDLTLEDLAVKHVSASSTLGSSAGGSSADAAASGLVGPPVLPAANGAPGAAAPATVPLRQTLVEQVQQAATTGNASIKMVLHPEALGTVHLHVQLIDGAVNAILKVEHPDVGHAITQQLNLLRQSFESQGIKIDKLEVNVSSDHRGQDASSMMNFAGGSPQQQSHQADPREVLARNITFGPDLATAEHDPGAPAPVWAVSQEAMASTLDLQA